MSYIIRKKKRKSLMILTCKRIEVFISVRNRTLTLIEREDDTRS
jgi:glutamyl-tRNA reductase